MHFSNHELEEKYRRLGFQCEGWGMHLRIGKVDIHAVEHPYKGVALFLSCYTPRTLCHFETCAPVCASIEQIACLIYVNVARSMRDQEPACKEYLEKLVLNVFQ